MKFLFADQMLDIDRRELRRGSETVAVEPQVFDLLSYLVKNRERVVSNDDLIASIWDGRIVSEATLTSRVYAARKAIGDSGRDQKLIRTIARKGHRFVGEVHTQSIGEEPAAHAVGSLPDPIDGETRQALPLPDRPAIAVLPFTNMSGDAEHEYFSDGISEDIITALSRLRWLFVIARNSSFVYKGKAVDIKRVGEELGVDYVVEGSVRKAGDQVRITVQLNDVATGSHIWAERYDRALADVFAVQDEITATIGGDPPSSRCKPRSSAASASGQRASMLMVASCELIHRSGPSIRRRTGRFSPILPARPRSSRIIRWLALAAWCKARGHLQLDASPRRAKCEACAGAAAGDMSNDDPMVLTICAAHLVGDLDIAAALIEKAVALDANSAMAWNRSGWVNAYLDRPEIAIEHFQRAIRLSPFDPMNFNCYFGIRNAHFAAGRYEESLAWCKKGMLERPELIWPLRSLAASLSHLGRIAEAREALRQLREAYPDISIAKIIAITPHRGDYLPRYAEGLRRAGLPE